MTGSVALGSEDGRPVYVDLVEEAHLKLLDEAMRQAVLMHPAKFWSETHPDVADSARLVIVPLMRLGAPEGNSNTSVFIGYLMAEGYQPSSPVVMKIGEWGALQRERDAVDGWPDRQGFFAYPFFLYPTDTTAEDAVLLAPFSSVQRFERPRGLLSLSVTDLWRLLRECDIDATDVGYEAVLQCVQRLYEVMDGLHRTDRANHERRRAEYGIEYHRYLRRKDSEALPAIVFGSGAEYFVDGTTYPNPVAILDRVLRLPPFEGSFGRQHGDLHPKNVVLDRDKRPNVIDYGWAGRGHVVKDYVLMDANLRAITLPSQLPREDVVKLARLEPLGTIPRFQTKLAEQRARLLRDGVWKPAQDAGAVRDWDSEYRIPLFLVAIGLLKHLDSATNQAGLLQLILELARSIENYLASIS